ncbi:glycosyl transferase family 1, partial [bacterium]|nr:glycosyl transferase family 1 [bacterium]
MKICLVGPAYPLRGGIAHFNAHLFFTLQEMGHQVRIISFKRQYPDFLFPGKTQQDASETPLEVPAEA